MPAIITETETVSSFEKLCANVRGKTKQEKTFEELLVLTKSRFPVGTKVVPSQAAIESDRFHTMRKKGPVVGYVVGYQMEPEIIYVRIEGRKSPTAWHTAFWTHG